MAALSHFPAFFSLSSHKIFPLSIPSINTDHSLLHRCHLRRRRDPTISASSIKKARKVRSNADLCNDIREFISAVGLPEGHVPSMKELSQHGRQDLANIVRRRGYKVIKELLAASAESNKNGSDTEEGLSEKQDISGECEYESTDGANIGGAFSSDSKSCLAVEYSANSSLQKKEINFIRNGELDAFVDDGFVINDVGTHDGKGCSEFKNVTNKSISLAEEHSEWVLRRSDMAHVVNGCISPSKQVVLPVSGNITPRDDYFSSEGILSADCDEELDIETRKRENQIEVDRLNSLLHQRELELSRLKEQIEKEQLALSLLQTKAETEISKARELISEKEEELHAVEESLSGLEEVQIQYWGDGETVEVAGSFNGWHHRITMDPQPSSILDPIGSRKSRLWTTVLWLYPGTYEIKFIVDGYWRIDPQRESVTRGTIQNNILRVD
ncbi:hypothetical protein U1Q18_041344 [Sarracenia purpurea var. burkii]